MSVHDCAILADKDSYVWQFAEMVHKNLQGRRGGFDLVPIEYKRFRVGEEKPKVLKNIRDKYCYFILDSTLSPPVWRTRLKDTNSAIRDASSEKLINVIPYLMYARQHFKDEPRVPITVKNVAKEISEHATSALIMDIHNEAIQGYFDIPTDLLYSYPVVIPHIRGHHPGLLERVVVMSPDTGGGKRVEKFAKRAAGNRIVICYKSRLEGGEVDKIYVLGDVKGKDVLMIDDMIDSGGTYGEAADEARELGAVHVYGYATFGLFTNGVKSVSSHFDRLFVSNIIPLQMPSDEPIPENVEVIDFTKIFAQSIYNTSVGDSISKLLK